MRFHDGDLIADARVVLCLCQIQGLLIGGDRFGVKLDQSVLSAYLEKVFGKVGLFGEPLVLQIGTADPVSYTHLDVYKRQSVLRNWITCMQIR